MTFWSSTSYCDFHTNQTFHQFYIGCGMPAGNAHPSGHLVPSPLGLAYAPNVETRLPRHAFFSRLFTLNIPLYFLDFACLYRKGPALKLDLGLSSHSAKLWDSCPVSKFRPAIGHPRYGQLGVFNVPSLPRHGQLGLVWLRFTNNVTFSDMSAI